MVGCLYKAKSSAMIGSVLLAAATLVGCSDDKRGLDTKITVTLREWEFIPSADSAPAGNVTLEAINDGKEVHELVLFKTDLAPDALPVDEEGAVDERGEGLELIDEVEDVKPGQTKSFVVDLQAGNYVMACNVIENGQRHFMNKMYKAFTVTA
jgi:uncharacterized cupredoxin-like copper-binding protein